MKWADLIGHDWDQLWHIFELSIAPTLALTKAMLLNLFLTKILKTIAERCHNKNLDLTLDAVPKCTKIANSDSSVCWQIIGGTTWLTHGVKAWCYLCRSQFILDACHYSLWNSQTHKYADLRPKSEGKHPPKRKTRWHNDEMISAPQLPLIFFPSCHPQYAILVYVALHHSYSGGCDEMGITFDYVWMSVQSHAKKLQCYTESEEIQKRFQTKHSGFITLINYFNHRGQTFVKVLRAERIAKNSTLGEQVYC